MQPITRRRLLSAGLGVAALATGAACWRGGGLKQVERGAVALGTKVRLTLLHDDEAAAHRAADAAFVELDRVEEVLSIYRDGSQVSVLNREGTLRAPHEDLRTVLAAALDMSRRTSGAFDVSIQPLWRAYAQAQKQGQPLDPQAFDSARRLVDWRKIEVSRERIVLREPGMALTFNGIAQGFATDRVRQVLASHGIGHALIDVGELAPLGDKHGQPWKAGIQHPRQEDAYIALAALDARGMATSGDYASVLDAGSRVNHILDPATGRSPDQFASVSIVADSAMLADALSTAVFVLGFENGVELVRSTPGADGFFVFQSGRTFATEGFPLTRV